MRFRDDTNALYQDYARLFFEVLNSNNFNSEVDIHRYLLTNKAPCWYCSPENALRMIARHRHFGNKQKQLKYSALAKVVEAEESSNPKSHRIDILYRVVYSEAPSFFISLSTAKRIILKYRKSKRKHYEKFKVPTRSD